MNGRASVERSDIRTLAVPVLRHRLVTNFKASAANVTSAQVIKELLEASN